jgi:hypothetical protein
MIFGHVVLKTATFMKISVYGGTAIFKTLI